MFFSRLAICLLVPAFYTAGASDVDVIGKLYDMLPNGVTRQSLYNNMWQLYNNSMLQWNNAIGKTQTDTKDTPDAFGSTSAFVHLFEWSWSDVALECEQFLGPKGFTAVQISPPNDHMQGGQWWTRYQPVTYELVSRSGDEKAFADMVKRCKAVGVGIYADAVINHIASGSGTSVTGKQYSNRATPIYSQSEMHNTGDLNSNCQINNYADMHNVQYCDLSGLPDLCTECSSVQKKIADYINHMHELGISGIRIDAAKHQNVGDLGQILKQVPSDLFVFQEVISGAGEAVKPSMYVGLGHVTEFQYGRTLAPNFIDDGKLEYLNSFGQSWGFLQSKDAVVFIDNHDTQRSAPTLTYKNGKIYELATIFMLAHPYGYPKVMSSYYFDNHDQGPPGTPVHNGNNVNCGGPPSSLRVSLNATGGTPWVCEHRWTPVANMVAWRKNAGNNWVSEFQAPGGDTIAFCRGSNACIALNRQGSATWNVKLHFSLPAGRYCNIIQSDDVSSCSAVTVNADGSVNLQVPPMSAVALHIGKKLSEKTEVIV